MFKVFGLLVFTLLFISNGFAHDANKAFFTIQQKEDIVEVQAEFPWSIRNALLKTVPELEDSKSKADFDTAFFEYIKANLKLKNGTTVLELISIRETEHNGHSHQNNFIFQFKGSKFNLVSNTIMFNVYDNQENYHEVIINSKELEYTTFNNSSSFYIETSPICPSGILSKAGIIILVSCIVILLLWYKIKKNS